MAQAYLDCASLGVYIYTIYLLFSIIILKIQPETRDEDLLTKKAAEKRKPHGEGRKATVSTYTDAARHIS